MSIELHEIFFRKKDSKIFVVYKIDDVTDITGDLFYHLKSNDNEKLILTQKEIQKKFN